MIDDGGTIEAGAAAWTRIKDCGRKNWSDWIQVARALAIGRTEALKAAETNRTLGSRYNSEMAQWLAKHGLSDITATERYRALRCLENLDAIETWRSTLDDREMRSLNHPAACWHKWKRATAPDRAVKADAVLQRLNAAADAARKGKPVFWSQAAVRRAHEGMLKSRSSDLLTLARIALESAIRDAGDLLAELPENPPATSTPRRFIEKDAAHPAEARA